MAVDIQLLYLLNSVAGQSPVLDGVIVFFASYLAYLLPVMLLIFVFFSQYSKREKWQLLLVVAISSIIARAGVTEFIRYFYHRPRPFVDLPIHQLLTSNEWSFPSGHAAFFFTFSTAMYLYNKKWGTAFFIATILMTVSRVIAGIHYPSDILGGAVIGIAVAWATFYAARKLMPPPARETTIPTY